MLNFECPVCAQQLSVEDSLAGADVECPRCGGNFNAPSVDTGPLRPIIHSARLVPPASHEARSGPHLNILLLLVTWPIAVLMGFPAYKYTIFALDLHLTMESTLEWGATAVLLWVLIVICILAPFVPPSPPAGRPR